jgi:hypothetical protein
MKTFNTSDRDSQTPKLAARDWERREAKAAQREAAETRQENLLQALDLAPPFELHRLPQNFWVAQLCSPLGEMSEGQRGCSREILAQKEPMQNRVEVTQSFANEITGCTDLYHITDHILFFRSNLPESELRENIDLSFLPF